MKQIIFVRHAKSDWGNEFLKDIDRPLNDQGYTDAYFLSNWFLKNQKSPDLILSSPATRALNTALIFSRSLEFDMSNFYLTEEIYESSVDTLIELIKKQDDSKNRLMLFGHNPAITNISNQLAEDLFFDNVPTCGMVALHFSISSWRELSPKKGVLDFYQFPKDFRKKD
jgi:phosphohistidine phosphatase